MMDDIVWSRHATLWQHFGAPLIPSPADVAPAAKTAGALAQAGQPPDVLLLGVTPQLAGLPWPEGTRLLAVDHSMQMIRALWPASTTPAGAAVLCADWLSLPLPAKCCDLVVGDGCFVLIDFASGYQQMCAELHRVLRPDGTLVIRVFMRPDKAETLDVIRRDLAAGHIGSIHALKWRLAAALHGPVSEGVVLDHIWQAWQDLEPLTLPLATRSGWSAVECKTMADYRGQSGRYHFPTLDEFIDAIAPFFSLVDCHRGSYELADRCPTLVLRAVTADRF